MQIAACAPPALGTILPRRPMALDPHRDAEEFGNKIQGLPFGFSRWQARGRLAVPIANHRHYMPDMPLPTLPPALSLGLDRIALFLDFDGTLVDIAVTPESVYVPEDLCATLRRLDGLLGGALAVVSGRPLVDIDRFLAPCRLAAAGQHGSELRISGEAAPSAMAARLSWPAIHRRVSEFAATHPGVLVEAKEYGVALHYRNAPQHAEAVAIEATRLANAAGPTLQVLPGKMVYELKPAGVNKGVALRRFMAMPPFRGRVPVFIGDDVTDIDAFVAAHALGGLSFAVGDTAGGPIDGRFPTPEAVRHWLTELAGLPTTPASRRAAS